MYERWRGGDDMEAAAEEDLREPGVTGYVIEFEGRVVGWIQWEAEDDPDYRHANLDIYAAIRSYSKAGFRPVGIMRRYERNPDGTWHDNLLMDLLDDEFVG